MDIPGCFAELIRRAHQATGERVVDPGGRIRQADPRQHHRRRAAAELREGLKNLYSTMKGQDAHIRLVFMTGVTKFSKVSLFSGLNQLNDLTLDARFATVCGYTQRTWRPPSASTWQGRRLGPAQGSGTTATASSASRSTTRSTSCCSSTRDGSTATTGSRPAARAS
jgi:hypothetical protein